MKNVLFAFVLLALLSCKKETNPAIDYSLLTQFKWQYIEPKEATLNGEKMTYSDTSSYVFNDDDTFVLKSQFTDPEFMYREPYLRQINNTKNGTWYLNADKGTLDLTYTTCDGGRPAYNIPCVETLHHLTFQILLLNKNALKLKSVNAMPVDGIVTTYSPIKK